MEVPKKDFRTIAFDFDGVIASYDGFVSSEDVKQPISQVVEAIKILREKGFKILIHSTRGDDFLKKYCEDFSIPFDYINKRLDKKGKNEGKPIAFVYVDDRAVCYVV
jgi:histidinol phosphatase-like enzyme